MRLPYLSLLSGLMVCSAMQVSAQDVEISITPPPGEYETLPTKFTMTFSGEGLSSVAKNIVGGNALLITTPSGGTQQVGGTFSGTTVTCTLPASPVISLEESGDYTVRVRPNSITYKWSDGSSTKSVATDFIYSIKGKEEEQPEPPKDVVYDIELQKTTPSLNPLDLAEYDATNEILQIYFNMGGLQLASSAYVTITGPEYSQTTPLTYLMGMSTSTVFKTNFTAPTYNGKYTLSIPQGVLGDEDWIKDHQYGHSNAEISYEFEVTNGKSTEKATVSIDPLPGEYDTLPETFVLTINGPESISKNIGAGGNPLLITSPKGTKLQVQGIFSGTTVTFNVPATMPKDEHGDYIVQLRDNSITYTWADGSKNYSTMEEFTYNVIGKEEEDPDLPKEVAYDIEMNKTIPNLNPLDLGMYGIETLQIYFNMGGLQLDPKADAVVTISGPNYFASSSLVPNMNMPTATVFKASFTDPKYSGDYTLTIPQGILGDEVWIKDHTLGHANAEVVYHFTVTGGEDPSTITRDLTFNPRVTPTSGAKVSDLSKITLSFASMPYWNSEAEIEVIYRADLSEDGEDTHFGQASLSRGEGNNLILTINPTPRSIGQYSLTLPEGIIWNEEHEADEEAGALNAEMPVSWFLTSVTTNLEVTGHVPATDAHIGCFPVGKECIVIMTNTTGEVASADFELIEYKLNDETAAPKTIVSATSTDFNANGYICWINNTGSDIDLMSDCYYEVAYTLRNGNGSPLASDSFEFYGDFSVGVSGIAIDPANGKVYNLQGVEVKSDNLPAGIYIKNGKKLVIR